MVQPSALPLLTRCEERCGRALPQRQRLPRLGCEASVSADVDGTGREGHEIGQVTRGAQSAKPPALAQRKRQRKRTVRAHRVARLLPLPCVRKLQIPIARTGLPGARRGVLRAASLGECSGGHRGPLHGNWTGDHTCDAALLALLITSTSFGSPARAATQRRLSGTHGTPTGEICRAGAVRDPAWQAAQPGDVSRADECRTSIQAWLL